MTNALLRRLSPLLLGSCLAVGTSLSSTAYSDELRIGFHRAGDGHLCSDWQGHDRRIPALSGSSERRLCRRRREVHHRGRTGQASDGGAQGFEAFGEDKVQLLVGGLLASTGYALAPESTRAKVVYISSIPSADDLTQRKLAEFPYFFRTGWTSSQPTQPLGQWACDQGYKKIVTVAADYAFGYEIGRRLPEGVRGLWRQNHPEDLASARHQGFRTLYLDSQGATPTPSSR